MLLLKEILKIEGSEIIKMQTYIKEINNSNNRVSDNRSEIVIVIYLYYEDSLEYYCKYMTNIPSFCDIIVVSPKSMVLDCVKKFCNQHKVKVKRYILKNNRGRDVSALLVSARDYIIKAEYVCFVHDKSANYDWLKEDVDFWIQNIWGNTLGSCSYIYSIIELFNNDKSLGALFPPAPVGKNIDAWIDSPWYLNYVNVKKLASMLNLKVPISKKDTFLSLSNVFWARVDAISPVFDRKWSYDDFENEPLPLDGTLGHAIERIWGYVVKDRGYENAIVMTDEYAAKVMEKITDYSKVMYRFIKSRFPVHTYSQIENLDERISLLIDYTKKHKNIYIYGAGLYGRTLRRYLETVGINISSFIVSSNKAVNDENIIDIESYKYIEGDGIIIAVSAEKKEYIEKNLANKGVCDYIYGY